MLAYQKAPEVGSIERQWAARLLTLVVVLMSFASVALAAQSRFEQARELAFAGEREAAREILVEVIEESPRHWDARIMLGRLYAWDKLYGEARKELLVVVRAKPGYADARNALVDVELWADQPTQALAYLDEGLARDPNHEDFLYKKASAEQKLGNLRGASVTVDRLLDRNPGHARAARLHSSIRLKRAANKFTIGYGYTDADTLSNPWHGVSVSLNRRTPIGSVILRSNWSERFQKRAQQFEIDAYPRLIDGMYAYVNYGYSEDSLYPRHRYAGELYANLPHGIELSAGFRRLEFANSQVTIYTGTVAKYVGSWWISLRPYITPKDVSTSRSYALTVRRYFGDRDSYLGVTSGFGSSPTETISIFDLDRLDSRKVSVAYSKALGPFTIVKFGGGYSWEQLTRGRERNWFSFSANVARRF